MGCNIPLANNACSTELDSFSTQVIQSAVGILAKFFPGATVLTQQCAVLNPVCGGGTKRCDNSQMCEPCSSCPTAGGLTQQHHV